jgi:hypothetical protein
MCPHTVYEVDSFHFPLYKRQKICGYYVFHDTAAGAGLCGVASPGLSACSSIEISRPPFWKVIVTAQLTPKVKVSRELAKVPKRLFPYII